MDLELLKQADEVTLQLEIARRSLDLAKLKLDAAKQFYDDVFSKCDEAGIPKAKLKKLAEERVQALFEAGMIDLEKMETQAPTSKVEKPKKAKKKDLEESFETDIHPSNDMQSPVEMTFENHGNA